MGNILVTIPGGGQVLVSDAPPETIKGGPLRALIASETGVKLALPFAPVESSMDGWAGQWDEVARTGRTPLVRYRGGSLPTLAFDVTLARLDGSSVEDLLDALAKLADGAQRITIGGLSRREAGPWRLKGCSVSVIERTPGNQVREAKASLSFVSASDVTVTASPLPVKTGPLTGGVSKPPTAPPTATSRTHTVKAGDTLWGIAQSSYGDPERWRAIADANSDTVRNPNLIYPGQVLTIPAA